MSAVSRDASRVGRRQPRRAAAALLVAGACIAHACARDEAAPAAAPFDYARAAQWGRCAVAPAGSEPTVRGIGVRLRRPANHDATVRHPLLVVFAPARTTGSAVERRIAMTRDLTTAGFLVAFVDAVPLGPASARALAEVPTTIMRDWCVDPARLHLMGHSDGGSFASMLAVMPELRGRIRGIVASAAGVDAPDLAAHSCPAPTRALILHSTDDRLFPGFGERTSSWWAQCNRCAPDEPRTRADGCREWSGCAAPTVHCPGTGPHASWPERQATVLAFLEERSVP